MKVSIKPGQRRIALHLPSWLNSQIDIQEEDAEPYLTVINPTDTADAVRLRRISKNTYVVDGKACTNTHHVGPFQTGHHADQPDYCLNCRQDV